MGDRLDQLPNDNVKNTPRELELLQQYFSSPNAKKQINSTISKWKCVIYATLLYAVMSTDIVDKLVMYSAPMAGSPFIRIIIKMIAFAAILYVLSTVT